MLSFTNTDGGGASSLYRPNILLRTPTREMREKKWRGAYTMLEFKFDTQLLIEGQNLSEDGINEYITSHFEGDCLLAVGDEDLVKIHFHTNEPWKVLEYCASLGDIYDVVIENMERQENGLQG